MFFFFHARLVWALQGDLGMEDTSFLYNTTLSILLYLPMFFINGIITAWASTTLSLTIYWQKLSHGFHPTSRVVGNEREECRIIGEHVMHLEQRKLR